MQRGKAELRFGSQPHSSDLLSPHCGASCGTPNLPQEEGAKPHPYKEGSRGAQVVVGCRERAMASGLHCRARRLAAAQGIRVPSGKRRKERTLSPPSSAPNLQSKQEPKGKAKRGRTPNSSANQRQEEEWGDKVRVGLCKPWDHSTGIGGGGGAEAAVRVVLLALHPPPPLSPH